MSPAGTTRSVSVFPKVYVKDGRPKPYLIRWKVAGREKTAAHTTKAAAIRFQTSLRSAIDNGRLFDTATCLPVEDAGYSTGGPTCLELAKAVIAEDWGSLSSRSNEDTVVGLAIALPALVASNQVRLTPQRADIEHALMVELNPSDDRSLTALQTRALRWLERQTLPVGLVDDAAAKRALERISVRMDGKTAVATSTFRRRRAALSKLFSFAVSAGHLSGSPLHRLRKSAKRAPATITPIDAMEVGTPGQVRAILAEVCGDHYRLGLEIMYYAGLRPSEVDGLRVLDLHLPEEGRCEIVVRRSLTEGRARFSSTGTGRENRPPKHRHERESRRVSIPHVLADRLRVAVAGKAMDDAVVTTSTGTPISGSNRARAYKKARTRWAEKQEVPPSAVTMPVPYSLRHACATLWLQKMPPEEVARRIGNSAPVLMATYANVMPQRGEEYSAAVDAMLEEE